MSTAIPIGAIVSELTVTEKATMAIRLNGIATAAPGTAAIAAGMVRPAGSSGISTWSATPVVPPMKSIGKIVPPMKPAREAHGEGDHLGEHRGDEQRRAQRRPVLDDHGELGAAGEERERDQVGQQADHETAAAARATGFAPARSASRANSFIVTPVSTATTAHITPTPTATNMCQTFRS